MAAIELPANITTKNVFKDKRLIDFPNLGIEYKHLSLLSFFTKPLIWEGVYKIAIAKL